MIGFTPGELALNREPFADSLPDTCRVERATIVADPGGGETETWAVHATVACRIAPAGMRAVEQPIAGRSGLVQFFDITLESTAASGVAVTEDDRIWHVGLAARFEVTARKRRSRELSQRLEGVLSTNQAVLA